MSTDGAYLRAIVDSGAVAVHQGEADHAVPKKAGGVDGGAETDRDVLLSEKDMTARIRVTYVYCSQFCFACGKAAAGRAYQNGESCWGNVAR